MRYAPILFLISAGCASIALAAPLPDADAGSSSSSFEFPPIRDAAAHTESNSETRDINLSDDTSDISARGAAQAAVAATIVGVCVAGFIAKFVYKDQIKATAARARARVDAVFGGRGSSPHNPGPAPRVEWLPPSQREENWPWNIDPSGIKPPSPVHAPVQPHHTQTISASNSPPAAGNHDGAFEIPLPPGANPQDYYMHSCGPAH